MANVVFKWNRGAGRTLLGQPEVLSFIRQKVDKVSSTANSLASNSAKKGQPPYKSYAVIDKKRMARGFAGTRGFLGQKDNAKHNTLLKSLRG